MRHRQTKGAETDMFSLQRPRHTSTLLLVPGGRWATVIVRPVSLARRCNSRFHSLSWGPLLPPQSAVMTNRVALG